MPNMKYGFIALYAVQGHLDVQSLHTVCTQSPGLGSSLLCECVAMNISNSSHKNSIYTVMTFCQELST